MSTSNIEGTPITFDSYPITMRSHLDLTSYDFISLKVELFCRIGLEKDLALVCKALTLAEKAHNGQTRREGKPYIVHPLRVAIRFIDDEQDRTGNPPPPMYQIAVAILHDVLEDSTTITRQQIIDTCGQEVIDGVELLTKIKKEEKLRGEKVDVESYFTKLNDSHSPEYVKRLKIFDKIDSLCSLTNLQNNHETTRFIQHQLEEAIQYAVPLASYDPYLQNILLDTIAAVEVQSGIIAR